MTSIRTEHSKDRPYVMLNKSVLEDPKISWGAKGLWAYLLSRPDNWHVSVSHLSKIYLGKGGGEDAIYSLLKELIKEGYCEKMELRQENGKFSKTEYVIFEVKKTSTLRAQPVPAEPDLVEQGSTNKGSILINENTCSVCAVPGEPAAVRYCQFKNPEGKSFHISFEDLMTKVVQEKKSWSTQEIEEAWTIMEKYKYPIREWFSFFEGIIKKIKIKNIPNQGQKKCMKDIDNTKISKRQQKTHSDFFLENDTRERPLATLARQLGLK